MAIYGKPVMSRETRRLLITIAVSVTALWVLARVRFQERPATATPVPNVLAQLRPASDFADLARAIADIRPGVLAVVSPAPGRAAVLRISEDAAITIAPQTVDTSITFDLATGLAIVPHQKGDVPGFMPWAPRVLDYPRYLVAADVVANHVALRPVFIGGLFPVSTPLWPGDLWALPPLTPIAPRTFMFTTDGAFAGLAVDAEGRPAIVPPPVLFAAVAQLQQQRLQPERERAGAGPVSPDQ